ncbi:MAG: dethiobiotin synthase [Puniceicoccales bacterium]|jgi:dethiobiotin synthetase|nr:dethiobiotin synthase [Puniceicoccales bacterium]
MCKSVFITATGTDIGKTFISGLLLKKLYALGHKAGYYKAVLSGSVKTEKGLLPEDVNYIKNFVPLECPPETMFSYAYEQALSPHLAAKLEGMPARLEKIIQDYKKISEQYTYVVVEGCGGAVCPIRYDQTKIFLTDIIRQLNLSVLVVAHTTLGTINATVLTIEYLKGQKIPIRGILCNRYHPDNFMEQDNIHMIRELTGIPIVACVQADAEDLQMNAEVLLSLFQ